MTKPFKLFYSTDWHYKGKNPESRIDQFPLTMEKKIRTFFQMGADMGCDAYGIGGDLVDSHFLSETHVILLGKIIESELEKTKKKVYYILGNHDIEAYNPASITSTNLGIFLAFNRDLQLLTRKPLELVPHGRPILLSGVSSYSQLDKNLVDDAGNITAHRSRDWIVEERPHAPLIHMVHGFLSPKPILDDIPHTIIEEMRHTKATVTLGAHDHTGFPVTTIDNGLVYNPGALGRVFASHAEMVRMPKYTMVTIYPDGSPEIGVVLCPVAEPGDQVMDRSKLDEKKARDALLLQARGNMQEVIENVNVGSLDIRLLFSKYKNTVRPAVAQEAERRLKI